MVASGSVSRCTFAMHSVGIRPVFRSNAAHCSNVYLRVSTGRQGRSGPGLEAPRETVCQVLGVRAATVIGEYVEIESGGRDDRPKLREALDACQRGKATLLIAKLDRLARSCRSWRT